MSQREKFEKWFCQRFPCQAEMLRRDSHHGFYIYAATDNLWHAFLEGGK